MNPTTPESKLSPISLLKALKRRKLYLLVPVVLLIPATWFYARSLPQRFRATALIGSEPVIPGQLASNNRVDPATVNAEESLRIVRETIYSPAVLAAITHEFGVEKATSASSESADDMKSRIQLCTPEFMPLCRDITVQMEGPDAFYVGFESGNPEQAAKIANRLAGLFVKRSSELRDQTVEQKDNALDAEVDRLRNELSGQEQGLKTYEEHVSQALPERLAANLKELETLHGEIQSKADQITEAEARRSSITEEMLALEKQGVLRNEPPARTASQVALDDLRLKLAQMKTRYTAENPEILRTEKEVSDLEASTSRVQLAAPVPSPGQLRYISLQAELKAVELRLIAYHKDQVSPASQVTEYEHRIDSSPGYEAAVSDRTKDAAMVRAQYEAMFAKQQEARLTQHAETTGRGVAFTILEAAQTPTTASSPHRGRILLFGIIASLGLGVAGVFVADRLDTTFETAEGFEKFSSLPVLSTIPTIEDRARKSPQRMIRPSTPVASDNPTGHFSEKQVQEFQKHRLPVLADPQSIASQQYGILALKVARWMTQDAGRTLVVTSATGGEGKSLTALNLALALAASSQGKVLLIDCDLRLPQVHTRLGLAPGKGFSDLLAGTETDAAPYISTIGNLDIIASGSTPANPVNLLASAQARQILGRLRQDYQLVILDSPPIVPIADSHILAGLADAVLLVVRSRKTRPELFQHAIESLGANNLIGVVLNDVEYSGSPYANAYRYYQKHYVGRS